VTRTSKEMRNAKRQGYVKLF